MDTLNWFEVTQKNKPQGNALAIGILLMLVSGMHLVFGILNFTIRKQEWTNGLEDTTILLVIASWYIAIIIGFGIGRFMLPNFGKKLIGFTALTLYMVSGVLYAAAPHLASVITIGRVLAGVGHGLIYLTTIIHGSEVLVKEIRGMLFATLNFCVMVGGLTATALNMTADDPDVEDFLDPNRVLGIITLSYTAMAALLGAFLTYESPVFLIQRNRDAEAKQIMRKLRHDTVETQEMLRDFHDLKIMVAEDDQLSKSIFRDGNVKPLITIAVLRILNVLTFNFPLNFVRMVLSRPLLNISVHLTIVGVRALVGGFTLLTFDVVRRRLYFMVSAIGSIISLGLLTILFTVDDTMPDLVIAVAVLIFDCFAGIAIGQLTEIYSAEAFPTTKKLDSLILTNIIENGLHALLVVLMMSMSIEQTKILTILYTFTGSMVGCVIMLALRLPETLKKTIRETRDLFRGNGGRIIYEGQNMPKLF